MRHLPISISPNPFVDSFSIDIESRQVDDSFCIVRLSDSSGKIHRMLGVGFEQGNNHVQMDRLFYLSPGTYYLNIKNIEGRDLYNAILVKK